MKREHKDYKIKKIHPRFFWQQCLLCKNELKNEDMWQIESKRGLFHVCMKCAKTREQIETYTKAGEGTPLPVPIKGTRQNKEWLNMVNEVKNDIELHNNCGTRDNSNLDKLLPKQTKSKEVTKQMRIGGTELITKENAIEKWKEYCIDYVNAQIENAVSKQWSGVTLDKNRMFPELIEELKSNFDILKDTDDKITISWR